jgi:hypothetical protein
MAQEAQLSRVLGAVHTRAPVAPATLAQVVRCTRVRGVVHTRAPVDQHMMVLEEALG